MSALTNTDEPLTMASTDTRFWFSGSYAATDVTILMKPISMDMTQVADKEALIQDGTRHYSEMLSPESAPSPAYMAIYHDALKANGAKLAQHINTLAAALINRSEARGRKNIIIVSLARAGTPIGVLLTRALRRRVGNVEHYSMSIIRGRGIDVNALKYILQSHDPQDIVFVDGWTGKGAIATELRGKNGPWALGIEPFLVVVADPAGRADLAATAEDYVIPSGILNGIVSGLVSRSVLNDQIGPDDFHGTVVLEHLMDGDISRTFVDEIDALTRTIGPQSDNRWSLEDCEILSYECDKMVAEIALKYRVHDTNRIKPGIAESTRAVLRRVPRRLLLGDVNDRELTHLVHLASERGVTIEKLPGSSVYRAVAIIAAVGAE
jgi:hypothetical protein